MEGLLLIVLSLIISSFFGNKKKAGQETPPPVKQKQPPQTVQPTRPDRADQSRGGRSAQTRTDRPRSLKELEDWTRQMLEQNEEKIPPKAKEVIAKAETEARNRLPQSRPETVRKERQPKSDPVVAMGEIGERRPGRLSAHNKPKEEPMKEIPVKKLIDSKEQLAQAIVLSEVLAPPISKRR